MNNYDFILEPYKTLKSRFHCPKCKKARVFTKYIDVNSKEYLSNEVGICNRKNKCGYHYPPKQFFIDNNTQYCTRNKTQTATNRNDNTADIVKKTSFIDFTLVSKSLNYRNNFIAFLEDQLFGKEYTKYLVELYKIGSSKYWNGATVFWQIDENENVRSGKVILYDKQTGKRVKKPYPHINWVHKLLKRKDYNLQQCLFGLHLTKNNNDKIAIVESEKTAIIATLYLPEFIWLACGSVNNLSYKTLLPLKDRDVILFPDLNCYDLWKRKTEIFKNLCNFTVSDLLEKNATEYEKMQGYDIADYLINLNIKI